MVLNLTRPLTSATFPVIATRREQTIGASYGEGYDAAVKKHEGLSREELHREIKLLRRSVRGHEKERKTQINRLERLDRAVATESDLEPWAKDFLIFEKPAGGAVASLRQSFLDNEVQSWHEIMADMPTQSFESIFEDGEIFRVEHDWFKAIRKANEFESGSFRLPFETSIFEFQVSRKPVVAMCVNYGSDVAENEIVMQLAVESFFGWSLSHNLYRHDGGRWDVMGRNAGRRYYRGR